MKYKGLRNTLILLVIVFIAGIYIFKNSSLYSKILDFNYPKKSEKETAEELRRNYARSIEEDLYYIAVIMIKDSLDIPNSFILLNRGVTLVDSIKNANNKKKDVYIRFYIRYWYNDLSGKRITATRYMNFDKNLNFLGEEK